MLVTLSLFTSIGLADPAVAELTLPGPELDGDMVIEALDPELEGLPEVEMDPVLVTGSSGSGPRMRGFGGRIELEAAMTADGVSVSSSELVFAEAASGELARSRAGRVRRGDTTVAGWVGLTDGGTRVALRRPSGAGELCAERDGSGVAERSLDLRLTRPPPSTEHESLETWEDRPSFVLGRDTSGRDGVYASLQPGDQITVVEISGGPRFVEEVELTRPGRSLRWRRDAGSEEVCYTGSAD